MKLMGNEPCTDPALVGLTRWGWKDGYMGWARGWTYAYHGTDTTFLWSEDGKTFKLVKPGASAEDVRQKPGYPVEEARTMLDRALLVEHLKETPQ